jgi:hypothetical protein
VTASRAIDRPGIGIGDHAAGDPASGETGEPALVQPASTSAATPSRRAPRQGHASERPFIDDNDQPMVLKHYHTLSSQPTRARRIV